MLSWFLQRPSPTCCLALGRPPQQPTAAGGSVCAAERLRGADCGERRKLAGVCALFRSATRLRWSAICSRSESVRSVAAGAGGDAAAAVPPAGTAAWSALKVAESARVTPASADASLPEADGVGSGAAVDAMAFLAGLSGGVADGLLLSALRAAPSCCSICWRHIRGSCARKHSLSASAPVSSNSENTACLLRRRSHRIVQKVWTSHLQKLRSHSVRSKIAPCGPAASRELQCHSKFSMHCPGIGAADSPEGHV